MVERAIPFLVAVSLWAGPAPRFDAWRVIGPGGAGGMFLPTVSPHDPKLVMEHCDMTGAYISHDAGRSWRMFNLRGVVSAFAFDPRDPKVIYAGNQALWRSGDTGRTWSMIFPDPSRNTVEHMRDDHAAPLLTTGDAAYPQGSRIRFIAVDPADTARVYVLFAGRGPGNAVLCFSADGGRTWSRVKEFTGETMLAMYVDRGLRMVDSSGVWSFDGTRWDRAAGPSGGIQSASGGRGLLYVTSSTGVYTSADGGRSWRAAMNDLPGDSRFQTIACAANKPSGAYVAFTASRLLSGKIFSIARTRDAGLHWTIVYEEGRRPAANVERAWIEAFYGGTGPIVDLGVAPGDPSVCYATDSCPRSFRTLDGGNTWQQTISQRVDADRWTTTGYDVTTCYGVHFDPFNPKNIFISYTDVGLFKSADGGFAWKSAIAGIPRNWRNTTYWMEFDPKVKGLVWGAFARTHDLPRAKMWQRKEVEEFQGGVATSFDSGEHWTVTNAGMPESAITHIVLDSDSPAGARTLYACGFGRGVYKSTDNGKSWQLKTQGIEKTQPFAWRMARARNGALYLVVARRSDSRHVSEAEDGALYGSTDGAEHWTKMALPEGVSGPTGIAIDPSDTRRMYLSAWGAVQDGRVGGGGVFLSTDAGRTWRNIFRDSQHVYDVTLDPRDPKVLYNCGFETGGYRSTNRGATWTRIRGFNFKWGHRVIPDPVDSSKIYVTTFWGSVWHGPAAGDPNAAEDILTPVPVAP